MAHSMIFNNFTVVQTLPQSSCRVCYHPIKIPHALWQIISVFLSPSPREPVICFLPLGICLLHTFHITRIILVWHLLLSIRFSNFIHVAAFINALLLFFKSLIFIVDQYSTVGFPGGSVVKNLLAKQEMHKRLGFNPWVGKIPWGRKWQPTPAFLSEKSHGQRRLVSYSPWGC